MAPAPPYMGILQQCMLGSLVYFKGGACLTHPQLTLLTPRQSQPVLLETPLYYATLIFRKIGFPNYLMEVSEKINMLVVLQACVS